MEDTLEEYTEFVIETEEDYFESLGVVYLEVLDTVIDALGVNELEAEVIRGSMPNTDTIVGLMREGIKEAFEGEKVSIIEYYNLMEKVEDKVDSININLGKQLEEIIESAIISENKPEKVLH